MEKLLDALLGGNYQILFFFFWFVMISFRLKDNKIEEKFEEKKMYHNFNNVGRLCHFLFREVKLFFFQHVIIRTASTALVVKLDATTSMLFICYYLQCWESMHYISMCLQTCFNSSGYKKIKQWRKNAIKCQKKKLKEIENNCM